MQLTRRRFIGATLATTAGLSVASCVSSPPKAPPQAAAPPPAPPPPVVAEPPSLLGEAKAALDAHAWRVTHRDRIGLVDFTLPSGHARFHMIDLVNGRVERSYLVAHGIGSDPDHTGVLQYFSNQPGSKATSRGAYLTTETYLGKYGRSQRLVGLDTENSMALDRAIVVHGAPYVDPGMIASLGKIGRSQGCFAFELGKVAEVMEMLGEGRMIYAAKMA
jgi:hypothetical protein